MLEREFINDYIKKLTKEIDNEVQHITSFVLEREEYVEHVGKLRAYKQSLDHFKTVVSNYFPST